MLEKSRATRWVRPWNTLRNMLGNSHTIKANQRTGSFWVRCKCSGNGVKLSYRFARLYVVQEKGSSWLYEAKLANCIMRLVLTCPHTYSTRVQAGIIFWSCQPVVLRLLSGAPAGLWAYSQQQSHLSTSVLPLCTWALSEVFPRKSHNYVKWCHCAWWCANSWVLVLLWGAVRGEVLFQPLESCLSCASQGSF